MARKSRKEGGELTAMIAAIGTGDFPTALARALTAWRRHRSAALADVIDAITARCRTPTIAGRDAQSFQAAWMRLAEGRPAPVAIGALADAVGKNVPVAKTRNYTDRDILRHAAFLDRIVALAELPDDPRIATALVELLEKAPYTIESGRRIYQPAIDLIVRIGDARAVARLRALVATPRTRAALVRAYFAQALPAAADAIARETPAVVDEAAVQHAMAALAPSARPAPRGDVDQLIAECLAQPDDDGPREVLADVLQERDDPRGEFITLQLREARGTLTPAERARLNKLLRAHEKTWLGELAIVTKKRVWRRGFLDALELARNAVANSATWERTATHPALASVRRLAKGAANAVHYERFITSPATRSLREIAALGIAMIERVATLGKPIDHVSLETPFGFSAEVQRAVGALLAAYPLRRLTFPARGTPEAAIALVSELANRASLGEAIARPARQDRAWWAERGATWLTTTKLVRRLGIDFAPSGSIIVEPMARGLRVEIEATDDWLVEWALEHLRCSRLVIGGSPRTTRGLATLLRSIPAGKLELRDGWAPLAAELTDRDRARRGRRS
jgi:uncharacterized protein (TIGR02996 family)